MTSKKALQARIDAALTDWDALVPPVRKAPEPERCPKCGKWLADNGECDLDGPYDIR